MSPDEIKESEIKIKLLQPGDLILIRTPSIVYEAFRKLGDDHQYDHIVTIINLPIFSYIGCCY